MFKPRKYTKEMLEPVVQSSVSMAEVMRKLSLKQGGGSQRALTRTIEFFEIDTSHFKGQSWRDGETSITNAHIAKAQAKVDAKAFVKNSGYKSGTNLRKRLIRLGKPYICSECGLGDTWNEKPITLQVDHIDGDKFNNELDNLRFICPNCHTQTKTWGNKLR